MRDVEETRIPGAYQEVCKYRGEKKQGQGRKDVNIPIKLLKTRVHSNSRDNTKQLNYLISSNIYNTLT